MVQVDKHWFKMANYRACDVALIPIHALRQAVDKGMHVLYRQLAGLCQRAAGKTDFRHGVAYSCSLARRTIRLLEKKEIILRLPLLVVRASIMD